MDHFLITRIRNPIEREYERWIVNGIENYFKNIGLFCRNFAVSPKLEKKYPADEVFYRHSFKLFGLQFKKATKANNKAGQNGINCDRLKWNLQNPPGQFDLVKKMPDIFYCLPTFINRNYKDVALDHSIFWRPDNNNNDKATWYNNCDNTQTSNCELRDSMRWGLFLEKLMCCDIGKKFKFAGNIEDPQQFLDNYIEELIGLMSEIEETDELREETVIYLFMLLDFNT